MCFATRTFISQKSSLLLFFSFLAILQVTKSTEYATSELWCISVSHEDQETIISQLCVGQTCLEYFQLKAVTTATQQ